MDTVNSLLIFGFIDNQKPTEENSNSEAEKLRDCNIQE